MPQGGVCDLFLTMHRYGTVVSEVILTAKEAVKIQSTITHMCHILEMILFKKYINDLIIFHPFFCFSIILSFVTVFTFGQKKIKIDCLFDLLNMISSFVRIASFYFFFFF